MEKKNKIKGKSHKGIWWSECPGSVPGINSARSRDNRDVWADLCGNFRNSRRLWLSKIRCWKSFPANFDAAGKLLPDFPAAQNAIPAKVLGIFRQGKLLLEHRPRLRERFWIFSSETATAFLSFSENSYPRDRMSAGQTGHMTGQMAHVRGTDGTHARGCPAKFFMFIGFFFPQPKPELCAPVKQCRNTEKTFLQRGRPNQETRAARTVLCTNRSRTELGPPWL